MKGALMVCGTASDVGKSHVVAGLCRLLARSGVRVAPFKAQNMALNSFVTTDGGEIGRAQALQAMAAGVEPEVAMNPVLLKPTGEASSQVVVRGRPWRHLDARAYQEAKADLLGLVEESLADLRRRFDVVLLEGAGSPAEINLIAHDLVNLPLAGRAGIPAVIVGDIDRGGVFASLYGTVMLLPDDLRALVRGFVVNKFRGDPRLLGSGFAELERRCGVPTLGVLPFVPDVGLDAEDSLALAGPGPSPLPPVTGEHRDGASLDVAVVRFPHLSNFTDFDALAIEPGVLVRYVTSAAALGVPDLVVLPGTKATVADLAWFRRQGFVDALDRLRHDGAGVLRPDAPVVLGICGGYQMLGRTIDDPSGVESAVPRTEGLGWLGVRTLFGREKRTRRRDGTTSWPPGLVGVGTGVGALAVSGYEIHHGLPVAEPSATPWFELNGDGPLEAEGLADDENGVYGTSLHGILECDSFRSALLASVAQRRGRAWRPSGLSFGAAREAQIDRLADLCEASLDLPRLWGVLADGAIGDAGPVGVHAGGAR